ncbi:hypothetical protein [Cryobacterium sp. TMS1-20-1]|uniref:hypothetical protein n=1 Tax=Cryobacterium sp. TMS1-20-1 TaxID=1259223 RepID=UPI00141BD41E|nr:hypothetical protein [Cryobacterium sp. TMS1-20-1]
MPHPRLTSIATALLSGLPTEIGSVAGNVVAFPGAAPVTPIVAAVAAPLAHVTLP